MGVGVEKQPTFVNAFMAGTVVGEGISWPLAALLLWAWADWRSHAATRAVLTSRESMVMNVECGRLRKGLEQCRLQSLMLGGLSQSVLCFRIDRRRDTSKLSPRYDGRLAAGKAATAGDGSRRDHAASSRFTKECSGGGVSG
jgi:hypothetical protein